MYLLLSLLHHLRHAGPGDSRRNALCSTVTAGMLVLLSSFPASGTHIIGGELYYQCLGGGQYKIVMKAYRDCFNGVPFFDDPALLNVFDVNNNLVTTLTLPLDRASVRQLDPVNNDPCINPPTDVCVEEAVYQYTTTLPPVAGGYQLAYQRCCRNQTITNIADPGGTGTTYYTVIPDEADVACNGAPSYNNFPPIFICKDEKLIFDHAATDPDGDSLVYELCTPFAGATRNDPTGNAPIVPPPYPNIIWINPYSQNDPLGGVALKIDPVTGLLTGIPDRIGQFVVGVCVKEYRNGKLIGTNKRDFQFNVMFCEKVATASVPPAVNQCGDSTVFFKNDSKGAFTYFWDFGVQGTDADTSVKQFPIFTYPGPGIYPVMLIVNKGLTCVDTAFSTVYIYPGIVPDFTFSNQCLSYANTFNDLSYVKSNGSILGWYWEFGDGSTSDQPNPVHTYANPGTYTVFLKITSEDGCSAAIRKDVHVYPDPRPDFILNSGEGCVPFSVTVLPTDTADEGAIYIWNFGDGTIDTSRNPVHIYTVAGVYTVSLTMITRQGCRDSIVKNGLLTVYPQPAALFVADPYNRDIMFPNFTFTDRSFNAVEWWWDFGDGFTDMVPDPHHSYNDTGWYDVTLIVADIRGCMDTVTDKVHIDPVVSFYVPNAFSPNNDGVNDVFRAYGRYLRDFRMLIYDRWGNLIFETRDLNAGWKGRTRHARSQEDVYIYRIDYTDALGREVRRLGSVTLVR